MRKLYMLLCALVLSFASYAIGPITGNLNVCVGRTTTLEDTAAGGTWTSGTLTVATVGSSTGIVSGLAAGTAEITYTTGTASVTAIVTVHPTPSPCPLSSACAGVADTLLGCVTPGYWSAPIVMVDTLAGKGFLLAATAGTDTVTYTEGVSGCVVTSIITVNPAPSAGTISGTPTICISTTTTFVDSIPGGTWSSSAPLVATVGATDGIVIGLTAGTSTISYSVTTGCGTAVATKVVNVVTTPSGGVLSGPSGVCMGTTITLSSSVVGGSWASSSPANAIVDPSSGMVTGISTGTATISYVVTLSCGTGVSTKVIMVNSSATPIHSTPGPPSTPDVHAVCIGNTVGLSGIGAGTWSTSDGTIAAVSPSAVVYGISAGTATITHTLTSGCFATYSMTVSAPSVITGSLTLCHGASTVLTGTPAGGIWVSGSLSVATVGLTTGVVSSSTYPGTANITYTRGGCSVLSVVTVYPAVSPITGGSTACTGDSLSLNNATSGGIWISSAPSVATVDSFSGMVTALDSGLAIISYSVPGTGCVPVKPIVVNPTPDSIIGAGALCLGSTVTLYDSSAGGTWSVGAIGAVSVGLYSGVVTGIAGGTAIISYTMGSGCMTMDTVTVAPSVISGAFSVAAGQTTTLVNATAGGAWGSSNTSVATIGASSGIVTGITQGTAIMTYQLTGGCYATKSIAVTHPVSVQDLAGINNAYVYPNPTSGSLNIQWGELATGSATVVVTDVTGRKVYSSSVEINTASATQLDLKNIQAGIYFISIKSEHANYSGKVVIER